MKKYIIKTTYIAKAEHPTYKEGYTETWYSGKERTHCRLCEWVEEDAYIRKSSAQAKINKDNEFDVKFNSNTAWNITREIIEL